MQRVSIKVDLERRLRKASSLEEYKEAVTEIINLLDEGSKKRETGSSKAKDGLGYKELVSLFRFHLGNDLAVPPNPNTAYIVRMVNLAAQMGVSAENVEQIIRGLRREYPRGPYQLSFILGRADVHYNRGESEQGDHHGRAGPVSNVYTGRGNLDFDGDECP